ncbi:MAG TPA: ABC transporter permease [Vicinamibacterales bacterium]|nr:ABC transporter permease [Vicinamibacterales bacterium]
MRGLASFAADLRSGIRALRKYPTLSIVAIVTLGLGLGLSTTVFCVVNGALFKGLPFDEPDRVVALHEKKVSDPDSYMLIPAQDLPIWQSRQTVFDAFGAYDTTSINLSSDEGRPERVSTGELSVAAFEALKVKPALGRGFETGDDQPGAPAVILLGDDVWRKRFGASPDVVNMILRANGVPRRVIGVMPPKFGFPELESLWIPLSLNPHGSPRGKGPDYEIIARLKHGVTIAQARAEVEGIAAGIAQQFPDTNQGVGVVIQPFVETALGREAYALLYTMLGAGIGVLLIACVNVSNLLVARASLRRREVAVRMAIGAGRAQIVRQHLTEVLVLALLGGALGVLISIVGVRWFTDAMAANPAPFWMTFGLDSRVVLFVGGLILLAALAAGALPALHASRVSAGSVLKDDSRGSTSARLGRFSGALVVAELAISCALLIAAGLMVKTVVQLRAVKLPFAVDNVLTMHVSLPHTLYPALPARQRFCDQLLPRLQAIGGVDAATMTDGAVPGGGADITAIQIEGRVYAQDVDYQEVRTMAVMPGYFDAYQVGLLKGRDLAMSDDANGERVAVVNASFAREFFADADPIGRRIKRGRADSKAPWLTVVGVVPDMLMQGVGETSPTRAGYYAPMAQSEYGGVVAIAVRVRENPTAVLSLVRSALASIDRDLPVYDVLTEQDIVHLQQLFYNIFGTFFVSFGGSALFLAAAGLYGVMSFAVTQRTREMGVRSALGAPRGSLVRLVMQRSLIQLAIGLAIGLGIGLLGSGPLEPVLYRVDPHDPVVAAVVVAVLAAAAIAASLLPAWRVTKIDPTVALAAE